MKLILTVINFLGDAVSVPRPLKGFQGQRGHCTTFTESFEIRRKKLLFLKEEYFRAGRFSHHERTEWPKIFLNQRNCGIYCYISHDTRVSFEARVPFELHPILIRGTEC
jgi:hypothetical protein